MSDRFPSMDIKDAMKECSSRGSTIFAHCPRCDMKVGLHCDNCKIQVTGCFCTEEERHGTSEAIRKIIDQFGYEQAVERLQRKGLWVPPSTK